MDPTSSFSHLQPGLDHLGFECKTVDEVSTWAQRIDDLGYVRGPVEDVPYAVYVTARTPDNIPVEFFFPK
jgi:glyoxylase I family protein